MPRPRRPALGFALVLALAGCRTSADVPPPVPSAAPLPATAPSTAAAETAAPTPTWRVSGADDACRASEQCKRAGRCASRDGHCVPGSDADCQRSEVCHDAAACHLGPKGCEATDADCRAHPDCAHHGTCTRARDHVYCTASDAADCQRSTDCRTQGHCDLVGTSCWKKGKPFPPMEH
jgi:hypothetical protein